MINPSIIFLAYIDTFSLMQSKYFVVVILLHPLVFESSSFVTLHILYKLQDIINTVSCQIQRIHVLFYTVGKMR